MTGCIVGWAHTPFGRLDGETVESLIVKVANGALADAGVEPRDVDEIVLGHFNAGFSAQDFTASLVLQASPDLRFKRALRVENACATGSAAVQQGLKAIAAKSARVVVPDYQLSLAIGKEGQNARLASRLTGWAIDIKSEQQLADEEAGITYDDPADYAEGQWVENAETGQMEWHEADGSVMSREEWEQRASAAPAEGGGSDA